MIILSNLHKLVQVLSVDGYNPEIANAFAIEGIPKSSSIVLQRQANDKLWDKSHGMLAKSNSSDLDYFAFIGSHLTSAFRAYKYGAKSANEELVGQDGMLMIGSLLDAQPTLREPIDNGLWYCPDTN